MIKINNIYYNVPIYNFFADRYNKISKKAKLIGIEKNHFTFKDLTNYNCMVFIVYKKDFLNIIRKRKLRKILDEL